MNKKRQECSSITIIKKFVQNVSYFSNEIAIARTEGSYLVITKKSGNHFSRISPLLGVSSHRNEIHFIFRLSNNSPTHPSIITWLLAVIRALEDMEISNPITFSLLSGL